MPAALSPNSPPATTAGAKEAVVVAAAGVVKELLQIQGVVADRAAALKRPAEVSNDAVAGDSLNQGAPLTRSEIIGELDGPDRFTVKPNHLEIVSSEHALHLVMLAFVNGKLASI